MTQRTAMNANTEDSYLRVVGKRLRALTPEQRDAVLDDVRAHFAEAADAGRSPEQAAESLGDPATFTQRVRAELGHEPGRTEHMWRILQWFATGVAVFTALFVTYLLPDTRGDEFDEPGFEIVLLHLVPALIAVLPILLPARVRRITTTVAAIVLTVVSFTIFEGLYDLSFFLPTAMLAWAALIVPIIARNGRPAAGWRITAGALTALPASLGLLGGLLGSWEVTVETVLYTVAFLLFGILIALGKPWAGIVLAAAGVALLVESTLNPGMLVLAGWWAGGLLLTVGVSHALAHARPRELAQE
ncbi:DUF1700 domain-containing protein [Promicromonospora iranensis]|uniref:DUF1700 domain-containing protein n=1 Tax=Promicromonospora iranensis TaxID=1105144 RepID=A0ABU2CM07_9MICO|nr:DUF1700 domain-containing protein [Promicromonospora iranensis]MDR7382364.1 hypothetical protein [Promicromonospora iranensis]